MNPIAIGPAAVAPPSQRRWVVVAMLFAGMLISYVDRGALSIAAVPLMQEFGVGATATGALLSAFFWTYTLCQVPAGYLVDRFGIRWTYAAGFLFWSLASAAVGFTTSLQQILGLRIMLGAGEAIAPPASVSYIRRNFEEKEQGIPTAIYVSGMTLGPAVGALLGATVIPRFGWRGLFLITGIGALVWLIPWLLLAPRRTNAGSPQLSPGRREPLPWRMLITLPAFWGLTIGAFFYSYYSFFMLTWLPSYLVMERGYSFLRMGVYTAVPYVGTVFVSFLAARAADRWIAGGGRPVYVRRLFVCAGFLTGSSILMLLFLQSPAAVLIILMGSLLGTGLASSNYWALTQAISPESLTGRVTGYQNSVASLAGLTAPMITGLVVERTKSFDMAIFFAGGSLLVGLAAYVVLLREKDIVAFRSRFSSA
jgi:MFS family permease